MSDPQPQQVQDISLDGKCTAMDVPTRTFRLKDIGGAEHPFKWTEPPDVVMIKKGEARWKVGFYLTVTFNPDTHTVKNVVYWKEGSEKFPKETKSNGNRGQPRNEKAILFQCLFKGAVELEKQNGDLGTIKSTKDRMKDCVNAVKECMAEACAAAGVE